MERIVMVILVVILISDRHNSLAQEGISEDSTVRDDCKNYTLINQELFGQINSMEWGFRTGFATKNMILLFRQLVDACDPNSFAHQDYVRINIKPGVRNGTYNFENPDEADYVIDVKNIIEGVACYGCLACGELQVTIDHGKRRLQGIIYARWIDGDFINGVFDIPICTE